MVDYVTEGEVKAAIDGILENRGEMVEEFGSVGGKHIDIPFLEKNVDIYSDVIREILDNSWQGYQHRDLKTNAEIMRANIGLDTGPLTIEAFVQALEEADICQVTQAVNQQRALEDAQGKAMSACMENGGDRFSCYAEAENATPDPQSLPRSSCGCLLAKATRLLN